MHLRWLEVQGFKAFAERERFEFGPGITVIVGPNGSGKSNIHDAIRWVLGEQAGRQLRARKTEDVIFTGSDQKRQLGRAEVTLALDNSDGWMPIDFDEVTVTRRAHRSGDNEYLINNQRVRLSDVQDLFRRAQVGQNSYAMMSQGLVDEVLALRPQERRHLIEEAADVRRHRHQITVSERRLRETRDNLGHARMLMRELEPRLRQLERQSHKAERYTDLTAQLQESLSVYFQQELSAVNDSLVAARSNHDQRIQELSDARSALQNHDSRIDQLAIADTRRRETLELLQAKERELAEETLSLDQQIALAAQRLELIDQRREDVDTQLSAGDTQTLTASGNDPLPELSRLVEENRINLDRERATLNSLDDQSRSALRDLAQAEVTRARIDAQLTDAELRLEEAAHQDGERETELQGNLTRRAELMVQIRALALRSMELTQREDTVEKSSETSLSRRERAENDLEDKLRVLIEDQDSYRDAIANVRHQEEHQTLLEELAEQASIVNGGAQALISNSSTNQNSNDELDSDHLVGIVGVLGNLIRIPDGLEAAIEAALAEQLSAVVVDKEKDAVQAIDYLERNEAGTATLLPIDNLPHNYPLNLFNERNVIGVAARLVSTDQRYRPIIDSILGRTIVVEDLDTAQRMIKRGLGSVVTRDGILLRPDGAYYGGRSGIAAQRFALQGELDALPARIADAQGNASNMLASLRKSEIEVRQARESVKRSRQGVDEAEQLERSYRLQVSELNRTQSAKFAEMRLLRQVLARTVGVDTAGEARTRRNEAQVSRNIVDDEIQVLRDRSETLISEHAKAAERATSAAASLAAVEGEHKAASERQDEREIARARAIERHQNLESQAMDLKAESADLQISLQDLSQRAANSRTSLAEAQKSIGPAHAAVAETTEEGRELAGTRGDIQTRLLAAEQALLESDKDLRESASQLKSLEAQLVDEGLAVSADGSIFPIKSDTSGSKSSSTESNENNSDPERGEQGHPEQPHGVPIRGAADIDTTVLRDRISELRGEIRALGSVNVEAVEDLSEERERHDFLAEQVQDLESAERELREAIKELRSLIRSRFTTAFNEVNVTFNDYFQRFFGGGTAELTLVQSPNNSDVDIDDHDGPDASEKPNEDPGVEISARPPGKRITSLNVLSGGERALTSVALLFALLSVNPAPICVLDEVDAALDEANVGRFADTLNELCERSQFIVITHNRRTIEVADAMYGVSMGEDSVSRVLSLKLGDLSQAS